MRSLIALSAVALLAAAPVPASSPTDVPPSPSPSPCVVRNLPATVVHALEPALPALAQQQGITGTVRLVVSLDASGVPLSVKVQSSSSAILNGSAIAAARGSTYRPAVRDCLAVPSTYLFAVTYSNR